MPGDAVSKLATRINRCFYFAALPQMTTDKVNYCGSHK